MAIVSSRRVHEEVIRVENRVVVRAVKREIGLQRGPVKLRLARVQLPVKLARLQQIRHDE
jgi:hypothetical protein